MRQRMMLAMVGVVALVLLVHDIPLARHIERVERDRLITQYERDAFILAGQSEEELEHGDPLTSDELNHIVQGYARRAGVELVVTDSEGIAVQSSDETKIGNDMANRSEISEVFETFQPVVGQRYSSTLEADLDFVVVPVLSGDHIVGTVRISAPSEVVTARVNDQIRGLLFVAAISLLIAIFVAWLVASGISRPLRRLTRVTDQLAAGDLSARAPALEGPAEVDALASSFNTMATRLEALVARQREFAGVASHQLRTPLTALRLRLEQLQDTGNEQDASIAEDALTETDRLRQMIEGLLALSRAEDTATGAIRVDLAGIARDRVDFWQALAGEHEVSLELDAPARLDALVVPDGAEQVIDNLIDNAIGVSPPGSTISVVLRPGDIVELEVADQGPGLSSDDQRRAFDRFWRGADTSTEGSGLGLPIVKQLVTASGGTVELRTNVDRGLSALVQLQAA